jgi:hypothetical protein
MIMKDLSNWLIGGGILHLSILIASALVPQVLEWRTQLRKLPPLLRQLVWVHGGFVVLTIVGLGMLSLLNAKELASGTILARSVCGFISLFWGARLVLQWFCFTPGEYLRRLPLQLGYHLLTVVFASLTAIYACAALS